MKNILSEFIKKNGKVFKVIFYVLCTGFVIVSALFLRSCIIHRIEIAELPKLSGIEISDGYSVDFKEDVFEYTVKIPDGHPIMPDVKGHTAQTIEKSEYQAYIPFDEKSGNATIILDDGTRKSTYVVTFEKSSDLGFSLQYDDRYTFVPDYTLKEGEAFQFGFEGNPTNIELNTETGEIIVIGESTTPSTVIAWVGDDIVDTFTVDITTKAPIDIFVIAGQGNASGEGGNADESVKSPAGTVYSAELKSTEMGSFVNGKAGFASALCCEWYNLTGEKVLAINTAVSNVSVKEWGEDGEIYKMASSRIKYFEDKLSSDDSGYITDHVYYFWCHGEWDISKGMSADEYMKYFLEMHNNFKEDINAEMGGIIPVRSVSESVETNYDLTPVGAAQYALHNTISNIYIVTRLPETATTENGYISDGNLYYTQNGYNLIGQDAARNFYKIFTVEADNKAERLNVYSSNLLKTYSDGENIEIKTGTELQTMVIASPLYIKDKQVKVEYSSDVLTYSTSGLFTISSDRDNDLVTDIVFSCGDIKHTIHLTSKKALTEKILSDNEYDFYFDNSFENNGLVLSEKSDNSKISFDDGNIILKESDSDYILPEAITLNEQNSWQIAWKGKLYGNSILLGGDCKNAGFIFLAPYSEALGYSVRIVFDSGEAVYLPYSLRKSDASQMNEWKLEYSDMDKTIKLYINGIVVSESEETEKYSISLTNLFGRYSNAENGYCADGEFAYVKIKIG